MIIDLSNTGKFNSKINNIFSKVCYDNRENFNELIKVYTEKYHKDIFWWVSNPASRNTLNSELFSNYCKIQLILLLLKKGESIEILHVSSKEMLLTLNQIPSLQKTKIIMKGRSIKLFLKDKIFPLYIFIMELFKHCFQLIIFKIFFSNKQDYPKKPLTLIDTFVFPGYYSKDRYYNGLWELLNDEEKKEVYFFPTIIMTKWRNLFAAYKELIHSERKFLFKEKYLKISDIFFSTFYPIRILFFNINSIIVNKIDYSFLITDDLRKADSFNLSIEGLINYRFIKRLSCKNVKLNKVIDWWESQAVDKGLHKGLKDFYPEIRNVGYLGYAPRELELQLYPTRYEFHYGVVPNKISVIGEGFIKGAKLFHTNHEVDYSSAFRFRHLWNGIPHIPNKNYYTILIGLPITFNESIYIIDQIINCLDKIKINFDLDSLIERCFS